MSQVHNFNPGQTNAQIEHDLLELPEKCAKLLWLWRKATLDREKTEALIYTRIKGDGEKRTADEIKALVRSDDERYQAVLKEITAEAKYNQANERLMSSKKLAGLRTAF